MNDLFVNYEQSLALKEFGFNEHCFGFYTKEYKKLIKTYCKYPIYLPTHPILAPTFQQAFRWFRDKHNLFGCIDLSNSTPSYWWMRIDDIITNDSVYHCLDDKLSYPTYEAAEQSCLTKLIEIVQNKKV
jgi:hypothetical protein